MFLHSLVFNLEITVYEIYSISFTNMCIRYRKDMTYRSLMCNLFSNTDI